MAQVGDNAAAGDGDMCALRSLRGLSRGGAPRFLSGLKGGRRSGAGGGAGGVVAGGTNGAWGPESRLRPGSVQMTMKWVRLSLTTLFEQLKKELADTRAELMAVQTRWCNVRNKPKFDIAKPPRFAAKLKDGDLDIRGWFSLDGRVLQANRGRPR